MVSHKEFVYQKGIHEGLDGELAGSVAYGKVRPGTSGIFWKSGFRWHYISLDQVQRIFRRVEPVYGKLCCGGRSFLIEWLVLILLDGSELVIHIGDDVQKQAEALLQALKDAHPEIQYGKV